MYREIVEWYSTVVLTTLNREIDDMTGNMNDWTRIRPDQMYCGLPDSCGRYKADLPVSGEKNALFNLLYFRPNEVAYKSTNPQTPEQQQFLNDIYNNLFEIVDEFLCANYDIAGVFSHFTYQDIPDARKDQLKQQWRSRITYPHNDDPADSIISLAGFYAQTYAKLETYRTKTIGRGERFAGTVSHGLKWLSGAARNFKTAYEEGPLAPFRYNMEERENRTRLPDYTVFDRASARAPEIVIPLEDTLFDSAFVAFQARAQSAIARVGADPRAAETIKSVTETGQNIITMRGQNISPEALSVLIESYEANVRNLEAM